MLLTLVFLSVCQLKCVHKYGVGGKGRSHFGHKSSGYSQLILSYSDNKGVGATHTRTLGHLETSAEKHGYRETYLSEHTEDEAVPVMFMRFSN